MFCCKAWKEWRFSPKTKIPGNFWIGSVDTCLSASFRNLYCWTVFMTGAAFPRTTMILFTQLCTQGIFCLWGDLSISVLINCVLVAWLSSHCLCFHMYLDDVMGTLLPGPCHRISNIVMSESMHSQYLLLRWFMWEHPEVPITVS